MAAVNQIDQTMVKLGHHNQRARPVRGVDNLPVHLEFFGHGREFFVQRRAIQLILRAQSDTHEKHATVGVAELLAFVNIQPRLGKNLRYGGDNSKAILTRKGDDKFLHRENPIRFRCDKRNFRRFCQSDATGWWPADIWVRPRAKGTPAAVRGRHPGRGRKKMQATGAPRLIY